MAKDLKFTIGADSAPAEKGFAKAAAAAKKMAADTETSVETVADAFHAMADQLEVELKGAADASDALGEALGSEMREKLGQSGIDQMVGDLRSAGLTFEQIEADAEQMASAIKRLDDAASSVKNVDGSVRNFSSTMDRAHSSADQTRSVMANLVGNSAQDMGELAGVTGSLGVGLGQLAEYATDGNIALGSLAKMAGPLAAVSVVSLAISQHMKAVAETKAFNKERVEGFVEALEDGAVAAAELQDILNRDEEAGIFVRIEDSSKNVEESVARTMGTFAEFNRVVNGGKAELDDWVLTQIEAARAAGASSDDLEAMQIALDDVRDGNVRAGFAALALAGNFEDVSWTALALAQAIRDQGTAYDTTSFRAKFYGDGVERVTSRVEKYAGAADEATEATEDYADATDPAAEGSYDIAAAADEATIAMQGLRTAIIDSLDGLHDYESASLDLADSVAELRTKTQEYEEGVADGTLTGEDAAAALRGLREAQISTGEAAVIAAQAFADQKGAIDGSKREARLMRAELVRLQDQYPELAGEIQPYIDKLDEIPGSKETEVSTPGAVGSKAEIDDLRDAIVDDLPPSKDVPISTSGAVGSKADVDDLRDAIVDDLPDNKESNISTPGAVGSAADVHDLRDEIDALHDKTINVTTWFHTRGPGGNDQGGGEPPPGEGSTESINGTNGNGRDPFRDASDRVKRLIEEARAQKRLADATEDAEKKAELLAKAKELAERASQLHADALQREADALEREADAIREAAEREVERAENRVDRADDRTESALDAANAEIRLRDARRQAAEANKAAMQQGAGVEELDKAREAAMRVAESEVELARERAEAQGKTLSGSDETAIILRSLQRQADNGNAAVGKVLQQLINSLNLDDRIAQQRRAEAAERKAERQEERADARADRLEERARELERRANRIERHPVSIVINAGMGANGAQLGASVVKAIKEFERVNGSGWRS